MTQIEGRPTPPPEAPAIAPLPRAFYSLLNQLHCAGGQAVLDVHGNLTIDNGRGMLSGRVQDWMKLIAWGMVEGAGDGRTLQLTDDGRRMIVGRHTAGIA